MSTRKKAAVRPRRTRRPRRKSGPESALGPSGWRPSPYDGRDWAAASRTSSSLTPGQRVALDHPFVARDQGLLPCCVSCAIAVCMEVLDQRTPPATRLSALFHYVHSIAGTTSKDVDLRVGLRTATVRGVCSSGLHPEVFDGSGPSLPISSAARNDARKRRLVGEDPVTRLFRYFRVHDIEDPDAWRVPLSRGAPIVMGFWVTPSYWQVQDVLPVVAGEQSQYGHAAAVIGYDDHVAGGSLLVKDSRGPAFGQGGHWWLPYAALDRWRIQEAWVLTRITY